VEAALLRQGFAKGSYTQTADQLQRY